MLDCSDFVWFQFHKVQLKERLYFALCFLRSFQFHKVQLKVMRKQCLPLINLFQFHKVQLKASSTYVKSALW